MSKTKSDEFLSRLLGFINEHAEAITSIVTAGDVAVVVFEPGPAAQQAALVLGWDGDDAVFRMSRSKRKGFAASSEHRGDLVTARWLRDCRRSHIFAIVHKGTLLINFDEGSGFFFEPGSLDAERGRA